MIYTIKKGRHFANFTINRLFPFVGSKITGSVMFDENCLVKGDISGWNKLTGIGNIDNHENSGRLVWRSDGKHIIIAGYVYINGVRNEKVITQVSVDNWYTFKVEYMSGYWNFEFGNRYTAMSGKLGCVKLRQYPYFGGQSTAPVTMKIAIV